MSSLTRLGLVLVLWGAGLAAAAQFAKVSIIFDDLLAVYPDAGAGAGFLLSLISLVGVVFGVTGGALVARLGSRRVLVGCLALGAAVSALQATLPPLPVMLTLRFLEGVSHLGVVVAAPTLIARLSEGRWQGAAMTLWGSFFGVAYALTALIGVPLVAALGMPALFLGHGAVMLAFALALLSVLPDVRPDRRGGAPSFIAAHRVIYRSPFLSAAALGWLCYTLTFVSLLAVLPGFIASESRAWVVAAMPLAGIAVSLTLGVALLRIMPATAVVILGFCTSAGFAGAMAVWGATPLVCIGLFSSLGLIQGASFAVVPQLNVHQDARALANGAMAQMGNLGNLTGTPILLMFVGQGGFDGLVWFALVAYVAGSLVHLVQATRRGRL